MKLAILGWGSLIWNWSALRLAGDWQTGGPVVPNEFSRVSSDGRLTLVIVPLYGVPVTTRFAPSACTNLNDPIANPRERENTFAGQRIGFVNLVAHTERDYSQQHYPTPCDAIQAWAQAHDWKAITWTALISNRESHRRPPFSVAAAVTYVSSLPGDARARALEYIQRALADVDTLFRQTSQATELTGMTSP